MKSRAVVGLSFAFLFAIGLFLHLNRIAEASDARERITFETGTLPESWIAGLDFANDPEIQVHRYNEDFYILRQSKCATFEAPFLYLIFGDERALLIDTGAELTSPVADTVFEVIADREARRQRTVAAAADLQPPTAGRQAEDETILTPSAGTTIPLIVAHSHGHIDHIRGDAQFIGREGVEAFVGNTLLNIIDFWGFEDYPNDTPTIDLGNRVLDVLGTPGHHPASISLYDHRTGLLLTGDIVYPGHLFIFSPADYGQFRASIQRLAAFVAENPVTWVLGCHIEMSNTPDAPYAWGSPVHPDERRLEFHPSKIQDVLDALVSQGGVPSCEIFDEFVIHPVYLCGITWNG